MVKFQVGAKEYYDEVHKWATDNGLREVFEKCWNQLESYGCNEDDKERCMVEVFRDWAPHSFGFIIKFRDNNGRYNTFCNGGFIYQGPDQPANGSFPSLTVSLNSGIGWFMHT